MSAALVALLHKVGALRREGGVEVHNAVQALFFDHGLSTLRLANTLPDGGWRNASGAGVGQLQMTAWDALRLLWLLDENAPAAPWWPERERCDVSFAHKTGNTENYTSDAGIVQGLNGSRRHYLIALISNLGTRYAPDQHCATTWRIPALAGGIDARLRAWMESSP